jgi:hypothetical protein
MSGRVAENGFVREGTSIVDNPDRSRWEMLDPPALYPKVITDDRGRIRETRFEESDVDSALAVELGTLPVGSREYLRLQRELGRKGGLYTVRQINTLVPILVHSGRTYTREDSLRGRWHPDIVLWYEPTSEFLALLPGRVREKLDALVTVSTRPEAPGDRRSPVRSRTRATARGGGESPVETKSGETIVPTTGRAEAVRAEGPVTGEATYPVARRAFGALTDVLVAPNPAQERTLVRCRLSEPRSLRIVLHDIFGREIRELANVRPTGPECVVELSLRGVRSGIYLVSVSSDRGEQVVQRLVVK